MWDEMGKCLWYICGVLLLRVPCLCVGELNLKVTWGETTKEDYGRSVPYWMQQYYFSIGIAKLRIINSAGDDQVREGTTIGYQSVQFERGAFISAGEDEGWG
jgi:hypothetical protein